MSSFGTGVIMTADGYIVTNAHVVEGGREVMVVLYDGTILDSSLVGFDPYSDLAVLRVQPDRPLSPAEFGDSDELQVGDLAWLWGTPGGRAVGHHDRRDRLRPNRDVEMDDGTVMTLIQTTAALNTGNSGGALLNAYGQVVGITNMKIMADDSTIEGLGFAIPSTLVKQAADAMIATGSFEGTPSIGITGAPPPTGRGCGSTRWIAAPTLTPRGCGRGTSSPPSTARRCRAWTRSTLSSWAGWWEIRSPSPSCATQKASPSRSGWWVHTA